METTYARVEWEMTLSNAAEAIRTARARAGISQAALARRAGIAQSTISRIESGELDPTWSVIQRSLTATGWKATPKPTEAVAIIPADAIARSMARSISKGDTESAIRDLTEGVGRMILASDKGEQMPDWALSAPTRPIGIRLWDTYLATAFAYALERAGQSVPSWMTDAPALSQETLPGDEPSPEFRRWLRERTPKVFLKKNILSRPEDWAIA